MISSEQMRPYGGIILIAGLLQAGSGAIGYLVATRYSPAPLLVAQIVLGVLWLAIPMAVYQGHLAGGGWLEKLGIGALVLGDLLFVAGFVYILGHRSQEWNQSFTAFGHFLNDIGLVFLGIGAVRAHVLPGWRRFTLPLAALAALALTVYHIAAVPDTSPTIARHVYPAFGLWGVAFIVLGLALLLPATRIIGGIREVERAAVG